MTAAVGEENVTDGPLLPTTGAEGAPALKLEAARETAPETGSIAAVAVGRKAVQAVPSIWVAVELLVMLPTDRLPTVVALTLPPEVLALR